MIRERHIQTPTISAVVREMTAADVSLCLHDSGGFRYSRIIIIIPRAIEIYGGDIIPEDIAILWDAFCELNSSVIDSEGSNKFRIEDGFSLSKDSNAEQHDRNIVALCSMIGFDLWQWPIRLIAQYSDILKERNNGR